MELENLKLIKIFANKNSNLLIILLSDNYPFTVEMLREFKDKLDWEKLSSNPNLKWSDELIEEFDCKWDWDRLVENKRITMSITILQKYSNFKSFGFGGFPILL
jgi:hypothetical protein